MSLLPTSIRTPNPEELPQLQSWLQAEGLAVDGLEDLPVLLVLEQEGTACAMGGVEVHADMGIIRSILVLPEYRGRGLAVQLMQALHQRAAQLGLKALYLVTETAEGLFARLGYGLIELETAPEPLRAFRMVQCRCAPNAVAMQYHL